MRGITWLGRSNQLEAGRVNPTFTDWQRINIILTGECVALLA